MKLQLPIEHNLQLLKKLKPSMKYDGSKDFGVWQKEAKNKLTELLGLPFVKTDLKMTIEYEREEEEFKEIRFLFESEEDYFVPCHLLIPHEATEPLPVIICLQGHSKGMHVSLGRTIFPNESPSSNGRDFAIQIVKQGYCALAIEQRNFGERGGTAEGPQCYQSTMTALLIGRTTIAERVWDVSRAIDVLEKYFPQVDIDRIGCMGNSGGGTATFYAACLEERIKIAMPSCAVCEFEDSIAPIKHCTCNYIPGIRKYFDMGELGGLIAPRPLIVVAGRKDEIFLIEGVKKSFEKIQHLYECAGAKDNCALVIGEGGHQFYPKEAWPVYRAFGVM